MIEYLLAITLIGGFIYAVYKAYTFTNPKEYKWSANEFETMTAAEKARDISQIFEKLEALERLQTDLSICNANSVKVIEMKWMGNDDMHHSIDLYADGINAETEIIADLLAVESNRMRMQIAEKNAILYAETNGKTV